MKFRTCRHVLPPRAFSLVEVVLALGVISFAIVAILGVIPTGLQTSHSSQDETRATQIAQDILGSIASQAQSQYPNATIKQSASTNAADFSYDVVLDGTTSSYAFSADNDGHLVVPSAGSGPMNYPYQIIIMVNAAPTGFDTGYASQITVRVISPPSANPNQPATASQSVRDFVRIVSKY